MKTDNPFDKKLGASKGKILEKVLGASVFVADTLDLCLSAAKSIFEDKATPELALAIYDRVVTRVASNPDD